MDKRKLSKIPRETASDEMLKFAERATGTHIVTCTEIEKDLLMLMFYPVKGLKKGKRGARIRTFFSKTDYITQDLSVSKVKWLTAALDRMDCIGEFITIGIRKKEHIFLKCSSGLMAILKERKTFLKSGLMRMMNWSGLR